MLQINSKRNTKTIEIDGYGYEVRQPGAGESLSLQESGRKLTKLSDIKEPTDSQKDQLEELGMQLFKICLALYKGIDKKAADYLQTLDAETLLEGITTVFNFKENESVETTTTTANA